MRREFLGDSYDLVKRFWAESLSSIAPIYAYETFIPKEICEEYIQITRIQIFHSQVAHPFALLLDPCTGIPSPKKTRRKLSKEYVPIQFIVETFETYYPEILICFDQSFSHGEDKELSMEEKRNALTANGLCSFYYSSHANFLFVSKSAATASLVRKQLLGRGIPASRLKPDEQSPTTSGCPDLASWTLDVSMDFTPRPAA